MCSGQCSLRSVHSAVFSVKAVFVAQCVVCSEQCSLFTVQFVVCSVLYMFQVCSISINYFVFIVQSPKWKITLYLKRGK